MFIQQDVLLVNCLIEEVTLDPAEFCLVSVEPATMPKGKVTVCFGHSSAFVICFCSESLAKRSKFERLHLHLLITYIYNVIHLGSNVNLKVTKKATEVAFS
jgi:hypothetical protein